MIAEEINTDTTGLFKDFSFSEDELDELYVAGWLHDFGKVATPEYIMGKSTKLEGLYDKIDEIKFRFEILKRDIEIEYYKQAIKESSFDKQSIKSKLESMNDDLKFLQEKFARSKEIRKIIEEIGQAGTFDPTEKN